MGNYVIWGNCDPFWTPLILADLHNISQSLRPVALTSPKKLLLQTLPVANWLGSSNITSATRRTEKPQEQLWALGLLGGMTWPQSLLSSRELAGVIEPSDHLFKPYTHKKKQTNWCTWTPISWGRSLPEINFFACIHFALFLDICSCFALVFYSSCQLEQV